MKQLYSILILTGIISRYCFCFSDISTYLPETTTSQIPSLCPELEPECRCVGSWKIFNVDCSYADNILKITDSLRKHYSNISMNHIVFKHCKFKVLPDNVFENLTVNELIFDRVVNLTTIKNNAFDNIFELRNLRIISSKLSVVPPRLSKLNLESLEISNSRIRELGETFQNMTDLRKINFHNNLIDRIHVDAFANTNTLQMLVLDRNRLISLPKDLFRNVRQLIQIFLGRNRLTNLDNVFEPFALTISEIHLENNSLSNIDDFFLSKTRQLKVLNLNNNELRNLTKNSFSSNYPFLQQLFLDNNNLNVVNKEAFEMMNHLVRISLTRNKLSSLPPGLFNGFYQIETIDLSRNHLTSADGLFSESSINLQIIALAWNNIREIYGVFNYAVRLQNLILTSNSISVIRNYTFANNSMLLALELSQNRITTLEPLAFEGLRTLLKLNLGTNRILSLGGSLKVSTLNRLRLLWIPKNRLSQLEEDDFSGLQFLQAVNFADNILKSIEGSFSHLKNLNVLSLEHNLLRTVTVETLPLYNSLHTLALIGNPLDCDCRLLWVLESLKTKKMHLDPGSKCSSPTWLRNERLYNLSSFNLTNWPQDCPDPCNCQCRTNQSQISILVNCSGLQISKLPKMFPDKTSTIDLTKNRIGLLNLNSSRPLPNLQNLYLERNLLTSLKEIAFLFPNLNTLLLARNKLTVFPFELFKNKVFKEMSLSSNPWACNCQTKGFQSWLLSNSKMISDVNDTRCAMSSENGDLGGLPIISLTEFQLCPLPLPLYVIIIIAILALLFTSASLGVAYIRYKMPIKVWLYTRGICACLACIKEEDLDEGKTFDAFIAYSHYDDEVVFQLLDRLEKNAPFYRICIHDRDFSPGLHIMDNILNAINSSKKIIILLSRNFLKGEWPLQEFKIAYDQMIEQKTKRILLVLLEANPFEEESIEDENFASLLEFMKCSTYLKWQDKYFWDNLSYGMPRSSMNNGIDPNPEHSSASTVVITEIDHQPLLEVE